MLRAALAQQWKQTIKLARALPGAASTLSQMAAQTAGDAASNGLKSLLARLTGQATASAISNLALAPRTRLNVSLSATRSFATVSIPLAELNQARRKHGASLNDALLFIVGSALRRLFVKHGPLPRKPLIAAVPVSTRAAGDTTSNTQATMSVVSLGTHIADPAKRLAHVLAAAAAMKASLGSIKSLMPDDFPALGVPWLMQAGALLYGRAHIAEKLPAFANLVISNVPGAPMTLYMAGARMITNFPASIVVHGMALNITVQTYDQHLDLGLMACGVALPETAELAAHIEAAFLEFQALAPAGAPAAEALAPVPARKKLAVTKATAKTRASARQKAAAAG
jgi:WS/DGAT/MGAT family acyltransferase